MFSLSLACMVASSSASPSDLFRARSSIPGRHVQGLNHLDMTQKLNKALQTNVGVASRACVDFSVEDLMQLQRVLFEARDPALQGIYGAVDDMRSLAAFGTKADDLASLELLWAEELDVLAKYPALREVSRDTKCHEAVMWFVHHLPEERRTSLGVDVPLLPERATQHVQSHYEQAAPAEPVQRVFQAYTTGLGCSVAHASGASSASNEWVQWPAEVSYEAVAHGNFPFWDDSSGPGCDSCDHTIDGSSRLKVMYSSIQGAENLMHEFCGDMTWTGQSSAPNNSPCNHLFTADGSAYIYTPKTLLEPGADGQFCCKSYSAGQHQFTGAVPRDWMKGLTYTGTASGFKGDHYSGDVKMFSYSIGRGLQFWYYASPDGLPVEQGEGCYQPNGQFPSRSCSGPVVLFHDWNQSTFKSTTWLAEDFAVPDVCQSTTVMCSAPGGTDFLDWYEDASVSV